MQIGIDKQPRPEDLAKKLEPNVCIEKGMNQHFSLLFLCVWESFFSKHFESKTIVSVFT